MNGHEVDYVKPEAALHGPATGYEWHFEWSIGDLRSAWQQKRYGYFFGVPAYGSILPIAITLILEGGAIRAGGRLIVLLFATSPIVLFGSIYIFMMWAAIYTEME